MRFLGLLLFGVLCANAAMAVECGSASDRATRDWLQAALRARAEGSMAPIPAEHWEKLRETAKSLRLGKGLARLPLARAPYFSALLLSQYSRVYQEKLEQKIREYTQPVPLELLFDEVIRQIREYQAMSYPSQIAYRLKGGQNAEIAASADKLGTCLANNAAAAVGCSLDTSDAESVPSLANQISVRTTCTEGSWLDSWSKCDYRNFVFNVAKPEIKALRARADIVEQVAQKVRDQFAAEFPRRLAGEDGRQQLRSFNALIPAKWGAGDTVSSLWSAQGDLLGGGESGRVCLSELAQSLEIDVELASQIRSYHQDGGSLADGAAFLASAVNRFFVLNGGAEVSMHPGASVILGGGPVSQNIFGGIGVDSVRYGPWIFDPSQKGAYDPTGAITGQASAFRIFPSSFVVGTRGEILSGASGAPSSQFETVTDLVRLMRAAVAYLRATRAVEDARGPLAQYFGSEAELASGLLDGNRAVTYPATQGRGAALGVLSGVIQNLTLPERGHVQMIDVADAHAGGDLPSPNMGLYLHDRVYLSGREIAPMQTENVVVLLSGVVDFIADLRSIGGNRDPIYPAAFHKAAERLDPAITMLALNLIGLGQREDGAFKTRIMSAPGEGVRISTSLRALEALSRISDPKSVLPWPEAMRAGFKFIEANRTQIDVLAGLEPALPLLAVMAWDRVSTRLPLAAELPALRAWINSKRAW